MVPETVPSIQYTTVQIRIVVIDRKIIGITVALSPDNIIPIVVVIGIFEGYNRALRATPIVICGIEVLNIVVIRAVVDNIIACVVLEDIIVGIGSRFPLSTDHLNAINIILDRIILDIYCGLSDQYIHQNCLIPTLDHKAYQVNPSRVDGNPDP
jgi:hypothetical protein